MGNEPQWVWVRLALAAVAGLAAFASAEDGSASTASSAFEALGAVQEGVASHGVVKPSFSDGVLSSLIKAATVTKVSGDRLDMEEMTLRLKGKSEPEDVEVSLHSASYHLPSQVLSSEEHSVVRRRDFVIEGDSMVFHTGTSVGKMMGNVTMVIDLPKKERGSAGAGASTAPKLSDKP